MSLGSENFFITDSRYEIEAKESVKNAKVINSKNLIKSAKEIIKKTNIKSLNYNPKELSKLEYDMLSSKLKIRLKQKINFSQKKRIIKRDNEIKNLREAVRIGRVSFKNFALFLQNVRDIDERRLNNISKSIMSREGLYDLSFTPITAIDENSAKPHAFASEKKLNSNSVILFDAGIKYNRYCSDRTRVAQVNSNISFSKEQKFSSKKMQKIYDIVLKAHDEAIKAIKIGVRAKDIDKIARDVITKAGYEKEFVHSTGHGVGLDIHELPIISKKDDKILEEGMVFTIEPGIYLPDEFGIRIEDMVVVTKDGVEVLR